MISREEYEVFEECPAFAQPELSISSDLLNICREIRTSAHFNRTPVYLG